MITVSRLQVAPVKSLSVVSVPAVRLERDGVPEDRRLFLLGADGRVATLRDHPGLSRVVPHLDLASGSLDLTLPEGGRVEADLGDVGEPVSATLFGKERHGRVLQGPVAEALSDYTGEPLRLVLADRTGTGWDEAPVTLLATASVAAVDPPADAASPARRFRMLVEVAGAGAYEEDTWVGERVRIGSAVVRVIEPLGRCVVINHSPETGEQDWPGLNRLATLRGTTRLDLGVVAEVETPGDVALGDPVGLL